MREMPYTLRTSLMGELLLGEPLTIREEEVLAGAARGETSVESAKRLHLSDQTVRQYRKQLKAKLGAKNTPHAVAEGYKRGILKLPQDHKKGRPEGRP